MNYCKRIFFLLNFKSRREKEGFLIQTEQAHFKRRNIYDWRFCKDWVLKLKMKQSGNNELPDNSSFLGNLAVTYCQPPGKMSKQEERKTKRLKLKAK